MKSEERALSLRELQVVDLAAAGYCDKEIAAQLGVSLATIRTYWDRLRSKTKTRSRTHAVCVVLLAKAKSSAMPAANRTVASPRSS